VAPGKKLDTYFDHIDQSECIYTDYEKEEDEDEDVDPNKIP